MYRMGFDELRTLDNGVFPVAIIVKADCLGGASGFVVSTVVSKPS